MFEISVSFGAFLCESEQKIDSVNFSFSETKYVASKKHKQQKHPTCKLYKNLLIH